MTTLLATAPASNPTSRFAAATSPVDLRAGHDTPIGHPPLTTDAECRGWGRAHGLEGIRPEIPAGLGHSLFAAIMQGYRAGLDERADRALLDAAPTEAEIVEGVAPWMAALPSPAGLADGLRAILERIDDEDAAGEFARLALASLAADVEVFAARTFAELQARDYEMAATAFTCRECGGSAAR